MPSFFSTSFACSLFPPPSPLSLSFTRIPVEYRLLLLHFSYFEWAISNGETSFREHIKKFFAAFLALFSMQKNEWISKTISTPTIIHITLNDVWVCVRCVSLYFAEQSRPSFFLFCSHILSLSLLMPRLASFVWCKNTHEWSRKEIISEILRLHAT